MGFSALAGLLITSGLQAQSAIRGTVLENGTPVVAASVYALRSDASIARESLTDAEGRFRLTPLHAGLYSVTVRKVGYRSAAEKSVRVAEGRTVDLSVSLTRAPRQLSTIVIVGAPTAVDVSTAAISSRFDRAATAMLPTARDAASLIALVPGARKQQLWGGAPGASNNYQLDGIPRNHPGLGGDLLSPSVDWIEALEVRGLGAGAEHGNFQGGIVNAVTRTGSNDRRAAARVNVESERLTATNLNANELGVEQAGRREVSGEALGPVVRDKLFYFVGGQVVRRDLRAPNLTTAAPRDYLGVREEQLDARAMGKLTWLPALGHRVDALVGVYAADADHAGINGIDDASASSRRRQPSMFYGLEWGAPAGQRNGLSLRVGGYDSRESRLGYEGAGVPAVQLLQAGRLPTLQNAPFDESRHASSMTARFEWRTAGRAFGMDHQPVIGGEVTRGSWRDTRTRNGGVTWRPYFFGDTAFDPRNAATWQATASDWGGDVHLDSEVGDEAVFVQDAIAIGSRLSVLAGLRVGSWRGYLRPWCERGTDACNRFEAARATGLGPRLGAAWDVTGRNSLAVKAHWGRYHQGMFSAFFDRARGGNVYENHRFYYSAPAFADPRTTFTPSQRDAPGSGFSTYYDEEVLNESGRVENYRQPYVDQAMLAIEKSVGQGWKAEVVYAHRRNGDIVGIVDRNAATNYSPVRNVVVNDQYVLGRTLDQNGEPLVLPVVYVSNKDLRNHLLTCRGAFNPSCPTTIGGYTLADSLPWNPDYVLTTVPAARRVYNQLTLLLRAYHPGWRGEASVTRARLRGDTPGITGFGTTGTRFSAGPNAHPNEAINNDGPLPDALELEGKIWLTVKLPRAIQVGLLYTHTLGERFTAGFQFSGRYAFTDSGGALPNPVFRSLFGQTLFVEPRGSRHYASRDIADLHVEWAPTKSVTVAADLFNALGSGALTSVNAIVGNRLDTDPTSYFMAPRLRVAPRALRLGIQVH